MTWFLSPDPLASHGFQQRGNSSAESVRGRGSGWLGPPLDKILQCRSGGWVLTPWRRVGSSSEVIFLRGVGAWPGVGFHLAWPQVTGYWVTGSFMRGWAPNPLASRGLQQRGFIFLRGVRAWPGVGFHLAWPQVTG